MQPQYFEVRSTGGRSESQPPTGAPEAHFKIVVIYIKDYLKKSPPIVSIAENLEKEDCSIVEFPAQEEQVADCSRERIGKLVDKLMAMPEPTGSCGVLLGEPLVPGEDPFLAVAERILQEELD